PLHSTQAEGQKAKQEAELKAETEAKLRAEDRETSEPKGQEDQRVRPVRKFPQPGQPWTNSLAMLFMPVPDTEVLFSVWETRVQDYAQFVTASSYTNDQKWKDPLFPQDSSHPVVNVNWDDATSFCSWLTAHERQKGLLEGHHSYRLPS